MEKLEIFLVVAPGLEEVAAAEAREQGFAKARVVPGGVACRGAWSEVWRANLVLRVPGRVLVRLASFRAMSFRALETGLDAVDWPSVLAPGQSVRAEAATKHSKLYHAGAVKGRLEQALGRAGAVVDPEGLRVLVRIEQNTCVVSVDSSGEALHRRGFKQAVNAAPMRETMAAGFLRAAGYAGREPVLDPMCGSGTFCIEAAEIAAGLAPGRGRGFAFEQFPGFDAEGFAALKARAPVARGEGPVMGSDRDAGAVRMSRENAARAGVASHFEEASVSALERPDCAPGLVICNPPYGSRIGNKGPLFGLYGSFGKVMKERFEGWRVAMVTSDEKLARATGLPWEPPGPHVAHGGLKVRLWLAQM
ncbi:class I SAM-dependent RNA methyltransferase [Vannielia litorea]|uniref:THUMP domain-containing class I SAM-dependent RNA methyltransferase n=1 Tax=Vannielia litorea TaxID=1217970 RepID=UPI001C95F0A9|nr:class I SAM-dependent RNA methyltransferase [Vannielia litorea]MBY6046557.1 class I SAM-dependent RNA methyltransferase [Vannielia litorea]MBY6073970.1 class I SAM-dependent RNA methyltransferase [Vannielia litorea]